MNLAATPIKFFPKDVIGKKPKKAGDHFEAVFLGSKGTFEVTEMYDGFFFAVLASSK